MLARRIVVVIVILGTCNLWNLGHKSCPNWLIFSHVRQISLPSLLRNLNFPLKWSFRKIICKIQARLFFNEIKYKTVWCSPSNASRMEIGFDQKRAFPNNFWENSEIFLLRANYSEDTTLLRTSALSSGQYQHWLSCSRKWYCTIHLRTINGTSVKFLSTILFR